MPPESRSSSSLQHYNAITRAAAAKMTPAPTPLLETPPVKTARLAVALLVGTIAVPLAVLTATDETKEDAAEDVVAAGAFHREEARKPLQRPLLQLFVAH